MTTETVEVHYFLESSLKGAEDWTRYKGLTYDALPNAIHRAHELSEKIPDWEIRVVQRKIVDKVVA